MVVRGEASAAYAVDHPRPGWAEQPTTRWEEALGPAIAAAIDRAGVSANDVIALAIVGQLDGCVAVDARGGAMGPCLPWLDRRAVDEMPRFDGTLSRTDFSRRTGQVADASHMAAKMRWLRKYSSAPIARFHQPVSYLVERLTGNAIMDPALASTTMLFQLARQAWDDELCELFSIDRNTLPRIGRAASIAGELHDFGAKLTGLAKGTLVAVGTGDDFATPLGAGMVTPGHLADVVGTAEVVGALAATPILDGNLLVETHAYPAGGFFIENPGWLSGGAVTWLASLVGFADANALVAAAETVPMGADGLTFFPALSGAMTPSWHAGARGAFYGLSPAHGRAHMARAVLEAMAFAARDVAERLRELAIPVEDVYLLGGGGQSPAWAQLRADILHLPHGLPVHGESAAVGAAMCAAVAANHHRDLNAAATCVPAPTRWVAPITDNANASDDAYARYRALAAALRPLF